MTNVKLTDTQRVVLASAGARDTGLVLPVPKSLGTNRGTLAIVLRSLRSKGLLIERPAQAGEEVWETREEGRYTLTISPQGLEAIGIEVPTVEGDKPSETPSERSLRPKGTVRQPARPTTIPVVTEPRRETKLAALIAALRRKRGATIADLIEATGWQAHSVRGAISGAVKKKLRLEVMSEKVAGRDRVYRIGDQSK